MARKRSVFERVADQLQNDERSAFSGNTASNCFFTCSGSLSPKDIGHWPQVSRINTFIAHEIGYHRFPWFPVRFDRIDLFRSAKLTDLISTIAISAHAYILSDKALQVFSRFNLGKHLIYPATIYHRDTAYDYHVLHIINDVEDHLDWSRSKFHVTDMMGSPRFEIEINDHEDLKHKREKVKKGELQGTEEFDYVRLTNGQFISGASLPDLFSIRCAGVEAYITSLLAEAVSDAGLSGFQILPALDLTDRID